MAEQECVVGKQLLALVGDHDFAARLVLDGV